MKDEIIAKIPSSFSQLLSPDELSQVTGVSPRARNRDALIAKVLADAGIVFWRKIDGSIGTTWHHVNNPRRDHPAASAEKAQTLPNFGACR